jgi:hypothetical protein
MLAQTVFEVNGGRGSGGRTERVVSWDALRFLVCAVLYSVPLTEVTLLRLELR